MSFESRDQLPLNDLESRKPLVQSDHLRSDQKSKMREVFAAQSRKPVRIKAARRN